MTTDNLQKTILVVDDSEVNLDMILAILKKYDVIPSTSGEDALALLADESVDLILLDIMMPNMSGFEVCRRLKSDKATKDIPVLFITAKNDADSIEKAYDIGGSDYVTKPFKPAELLARVKVQLRLQEMINELVDLNLMKDNVLAVCSHDLRSPLNGILGFTNLVLKKDYLETEDREALTHIETSGNLLLGLINDILDLSKARAEQVELKMDPISLPAAVRTSIIALKHMADGKQQQLQLTVDCPDAMISGNSSGISRVFNNLLSNAIKFTPENGQINVDIESAPDEHVVVKMTDTGIGIPKEKIPCLFDQFTRASQTGTSGEKGTGLGMSIVKEILERHNADIEVISREGKGTCFKLTFSRITAAPEYIGLEPENTGADEKQYRILIVDDISSNRLEPVQNIPKSEVLSNLPPEWKTKMKQAIEHVNLDQMHSFIDQLREHDKTSADAIQERIDQFDYEKVLKLLG